MLGELQFSNPLAQPVLDRACDLRAAEWGIAAVAAPDVPLWRQWSFLDCGGAGLIPPGANAHQRLTFRTDRLQGEAETPLPPGDYLAFAKIPRIGERAVPFRIAD